METHIVTATLLKDPRWVEIDYVNWRGERAVRVILPMRLAFTATEWHPDEQWVCWAHDLRDRPYGPVKAFAMNSVHSWKPYTK